MKLFLLLILFLSTSAPSATTLTANRTDELLTASFTVGAREFYVHEFGINRRQGARVFGKFRASGGRNDIECFLVDDDGLENFRNGNEARVYYASGRVTVATINVWLAPNRYYLVFNNKFSAMTPKAVNPRIFIADQ